MRVLLAAIVLLALGLTFPLAAGAERVTPKSTVVNHVNVRDGPSTSGTSVVTTLSPGEYLPYDGSVPRWYRVQLPDGSFGFVSKGWTEVVADAVNLAQIGDFAVHFLDVGTGDSAIIDVGDREIIIDGGNYPNDLRTYVEAAGIIDGPVELVIVTHGDTDHWKGLTRFLGFDGHSDNPPQVLEFWEPGYDRNCNRANSSARQNYLTFISDMQAAVPPTGFRRPLEDHHAPTTATGQVQPFTVASLPGVTFMLLHTNSNPTTGSCSYKINNASVVVLIEIAGVRFLFTGDANGKERDAVSPVVPSHVEGRLLQIEGNFPGTLKADVLKAPHHGSETANTVRFIEAVDPRFVVISASTTHHLPRPTVVDRYENGQRVILRTDEDRRKGIDHVVCARTDGELDCNFADVLSE